MERLPTPAGSSQLEVIPPPPREPLPPRGLSASQQVPHFILMKGKNPEAPVYRWVFDLASITSHVSRLFGGPDIDLQDRYL